MLSSLGHSGQRFLDHMGLHLSWRSTHMLSFFILMRKSIASVVMGPTFIHALVARHGGALLTPGLSEAERWESVSVVISPARGKYRSVCFRVVLLHLLDPSGQCRMVTVGTGTFALFSAPAGMLPRYCWLFPLRRPRVFTHCRTFVLCFCLSALMWLHLVLPSLCTLSQSSAIH